MKVQNLALLSALLPLAAIAGGCGGGNGGPTTVATPAPTFIGPSTGTPVLPTTPIPRVLLRLPSGQIAALDLTRTGGVAQGTLRVLTGTASTNSLDVGAYAVTGAFAAPTAFSVQGPASAPNRFSLSGNVPQNDRNEGLTFTQGKFTGTGSLLAPNSTTFPGSAPYTTIGDLQFTNFTSLVTGALPPVSVTPTGPAALTASPTTGVFGYEILGDQISPRLDLEGARAGFNLPGQRLSIFTRITPASPSQANPNLLSVGQTFSLTPGALNSGSVASLSIGYAGRNYLSNSGTLTIRNIGVESVTLAYNNVRVATNEISGSSFIVNGTFTVPVGVLTAIRRL